MRHKGRKHWNAKKNYQENGTPRDWICWRSWLLREVKTSSRSLKDLKVDSCRRWKPLSLRPKKSRWHSKKVDVAWKTSPGRPLCQNADDNEISFIWELATSRINSIPYPDGNQNEKLIFLQFLFALRRAKDHEKLAKFAASLYKTVKASIALSPLYVFSAEAFTDIYLEAEGYRSSILIS